MTAIGQFKVIQVKLHIDEVVPVIMVNKAYCSQTQLEWSYPYHTHQRDYGNDKFPWISGNKRQAKPPKLLFFALDPLARKRLTIN